MYHFYRFLQYFYSILWCERPGLVHPRPDSDSPMRCDAMRLTRPTNGQKNAAPAPRTPRHPQPGRVRHMLAAGACKAYHTVDVNHTCPAWRAAHTHTAKPSGRAGEHPWGFGAKRKRLLRLLFGLGPLPLAVSFATHKSHTTKTKLPATICCGVPFASAGLFLALGWLLRRVVGWLLRVVGRSK